MSANEGQYMPLWLYNFVTVSAVVDYMMEDRPLPASVAKYARYYSQQYVPCELSAMVAASEEIIMFIATLNVDDPLGLIDFYRFYCLNYENSQKKRKRDSLFGDIFQGSKTKTYSYENAIKGFKAYTFSLRSNQAPMPDASWTLNGETGEDGQVEKLIALTNQPLEDADYQYTADMGVDMGESEES